MADPMHEGAPDTAPAKRTRSLLMGATVVALLLAGGWWLTARDDPAAGQAGPGGQTSVGGRIVEEFAPGKRQEIEHFEATLLDGDAFDTRDLLGQVAVYNVWGSWCGPCRVEAPDLVRVAEETAGEVQFVGINVRDNDDAARAFERRYAVPYPSTTTAASADALLAFGGALATSAIPSTVVVDQDGRVAARVVGPVSYSTLDALVSTVMAESPSGAP